MNPLVGFLGWPLSPVEIEEHPLFFKMLENKQVVLLPPTPGSQSVAFRTMANSRAGGKNESQQPWEFSTALRTWGHWNGPVRELTGSFAVFKFALAEPFLSAFHSILSCNLNPQSHIWNKDSCQLCH